MTSFHVTNDAANSPVLHRSSNSFATNDDCVDVTKSWNSAMMAVDQLRTMKRREETFYKCPNYLRSAAASTPLRQKSSAMSPTFLSVMQETPLQLQQAAIDECARFIDSLSVSPPRADAALPPSPSFVDVTVSTTEQLCDDHSHHEKSIIAPSSFNLSFFFPWTQKHHAQHSPACVAHPGISTTDHSNSCFSSLDTASTAESVCKKKLIATWRRQMCIWSYQVVDTYAFSRDTVPTAFSILDRYLAASFATDCDKVTELDRIKFQLLSMTSLMIAIKVIQPSYAKLSLEALMDMSRRVYTAEDFQRTEMNILLLLNWHVHPPTPIAFVRSFLNAANGATVFKFTNKGGDGRCYEEVLEAATRWTELAVGDAMLVSYKPSNIALAAILISCHCYNSKYAALPLTIANDFMMEMKEVMGIHIWSRDVEELFKKFHAIQSHP